MLFVAVYYDSAYCKREEVWKHEGHRRVGHNQDDRLLIVNADDFGMCHSANAGIQQLLEEGAISSATLMMPCGWAKEAADWSARHPQYDVGVHLTFTSEWSGYKWGPVTRHAAVRSLVTDEGYFPADCASFERQADPEHVRTEIISQIDMALSTGLQPTHLDNHMGSLYGLATGRDFLAVVLDICAEYGLPFRLPKSLPTVSRVTPEMAERSKAAVALAEAKGVVILDNLLGLPFELGEGETYESFKASMAQLLRRLQPGISEIIIHPAHVTDELKSIHGQWRKRGMEFDVFRDPDIRRVIEDEGIRLIRWADLRDVQRRLHR